MYFWPHYVRATCDNLHQSARRGVNHFQNIIKTIISNLHWGPATAPEVISIISTLSSQMSPMPVLSLRCWLFSGHVAELHPLKVFET